MQTKLTLRLDQELIQAAKSVAEQRGQSVSKMVAGYFQSLSEKSASKSIGLSPTVKALKGAWRGKKIDRQDYHRYLEEKYI